MSPNPVAFEALLLIVHPVKLTVAPGALTLKAPPNVLLLVDSTRFPDRTVFRTSMIEGVDPPFSASMMIAPPDAFDPATLLPARMSTRGLAIAAVARALNVALEELLECFSPDELRRSCFAHAVARAGGPASGLASA